MKLNHESYLYPLRIKKLSIYNPFGLNQIYILVFLVIIHFIIYFTFTCSFNYVLYLHVVNYSSHHALFPQKMMFLMSYLYTYKTNNPKFVRLSISSGSFLFYRFRMGHNVEICLFKFSPPSLLFINPRVKLHT